MKTAEVHRIRANPLPVLRWSLVLGLLGVLFGIRLFAATPVEKGKPETPAGSWYETRFDHSPDGTGKFYFGRETARYMSHLGASWLERPEREDEEKPAKLVESLNLASGQAVADIGAGSGYLSWRMAKKVGENGRVYATDIQPEMLAYLRTNMMRMGVTNVIPVLGTMTDPKLPTNSIDLAIMVDVYHEFDHPYEMMHGICQALKPGGRVVFVEYRGEDKWVPIKPLHKLTEAQVRREMEPHPLTWVETLRILPRQHVILFKRE